MILFEETRPATLEDVRWLRQNLGRRLKDSCLRAIDPKLGGRCLSLPLIDSILLAVTEIGNNIVQHASPKPTFVSLEVRLAGPFLRIELRDDGGSFDEFATVLENAGRVPNSADRISGRGLSLISQALQDIEYHAGSPNRLIGWRKLRKAQPHVLIVARDAVDRGNLCTMLSQNYETSPVRTVAEAQVILASHRVDAILADYDPAYHREDLFKAEFDQSSIPVILMAWPDEFEVFRRYPFSIDQCLPKPISTFALITAIEVAIASYTRRLIHLANYFGHSAGALLANELPRELPSYRIEIISGTATYGGGDFALALAGKGFTRIVLGDIMGHGLKAKAGAITLSSIIRTLHYQESVSAGGLLQNTSRIISNEPAFTDIISTIIVVDAAENGRIEAASAGHPPVAIISPESSFVLPVTGPLPGLLPDPVYRVASHELRPGDKIAIVTDGIDSQSSATADFPERLLKRLAQNQHCPLAQLKAEMQRCLSRRLGPAPDDDWTLMIGEYCGIPARLSRKHQEAEAALPQPQN
ncbi:MAG: SpoIIE family protein phosphatase [Rhodomicrobium sp.]